MFCNLSVYIAILLQLISLTGFAGSFFFLAVAIITSFDVNNGDNHQWSLNRTKQAGLQLYTWKGAAAIQTVGHNRTTHQTI
jgi:hypothetical protein